MDPYSMRLSLIIPVYRGKEILFELFRRIDETLSAKYEFEVLLICDGCDNESLHATDELIRYYPSQLKVYKLAKNYGQHRAIQFGFTKATGDFIITIDEDLQQNPSDILTLIEKQKEADYDIVYGRFVNPKHNSRRNILSAFTRKVLKHFIPSICKEYSPYRLIRREIATRTSTMGCPYVFIDDLLSRITKILHLLMLTILKDHQVKVHTPLVRLLEMVYTFCWPIQA